MRWKQASVILTFLLTALAIPIGTPVFVHPVLAVCTSVVINPARPVTADNITATATTTCTGASKGKFLWFNSTNSLGPFYNAFAGNPLTATSWVHDFLAPGAWSVEVDVLDASGKTIDIASKSFTVFAASVGGVLAHVDKLALLAPFIGLASLIVAATTVTAVYVERAKHRKEKQ